MTATLVTRLAARLPGLIGGRGAPAVLSLLDQGLVSGFGFLSGIATARLIGIEGFGRFAIVMIVASLAQGVHNALVTAPMMTLVGARPHTSPIYFASLLAGATLLAVAAALATALVLGLMFGLKGSHCAVSFMVAAAVVTGAQNLQFTLRRLLFACDKGLQALSMDLLRAFVFAGALMAFARSGSVIHLNTILLTLGVSALVAGLPFVAPFLRARARHLRLGAVAYRHGSIARWLLPVVFVTFGQEQLVWMAAGGLLGDHEIGGLRAAQYVVGLVLLLLAATENILPVGAGRAFAQGGMPALRRYLLTAGALLGALVAVPLLAILAAPDLWLRLVFGAAFVPYAGCLRILALSIVFVLVRDMAAQVFRATQRTAVIFRAFVASLVVSLALVGPLLVHGGLLGATVVVLVGHATSMSYLLGALCLGRPLEGAERRAPAADPRPGWIGRIARDFTGRWGGIARESRDGAA